jgi:UDP-N-acetylmuramyl pentapeptide phosphotransferase/UDP-N-acetylglucosamine-1-phosphate transferase
MISLSTGTVVIVSTFLSWLILFLLLPVLRRRLLDLPNSRSSHKAPIPRGGGLVFVLVGSAASLFAVLTSLLPLSSTQAGLLLAPLIALPLALIGLIDDHLNLPASIRYFAQFATGIALLYLSRLPVQWMIAPLVVIAITAIINFVNFMDGLDGLVVGCMTLCIATSAIHFSAPWSLWALVGALLGFLFWNWSPAKVFMGDVGSTYLGALYAGIVLQSVRWSEAVAMVLLAAPLLLDSSICVLRRARANQRIFTPHRLHLYQRLHQAGWSHASVSSLYIGATLLLCLLMLLGNLPWLLASVLIIALLGVWLDQFIARPFSDSSAS